MPTCANCGKERLESDRAYGISPYAICNCCVHSYRPIEITPKMIDAGVAVLRRYDWNELGKDEAIRKIVSAALSAYGADT